MTDKQNLSNIFHHHKLTFLLVDWNIYQSQLRAIRQAVFVEEQKVPQQEEWDEHDETAHHYIVLTEDNSPIATARLLPTGQIGRMAVMQDFRRYGVGLKLLKFVLDSQPAAQFTTFFLHAQVSAIPFYQRASFVITSDIFEEAGILHRTMELSRD